jgi:hypothetical protein
MKVKINIKKNSKAEKAIKSLAQQKEEFRNAVENGTVEEYAKKHRSGISQPLRLND